LICSFVWEGLSNTKDKWYPEKNKKETCDDIFAYVKTAIVNSYKKSGDFDEYKRSGEIIVSQEDKFRRIHRKRKKELKQQLPDINLIDEIFISDNEIQAAAEDGDLNLIKVTIDLELILKQIKNIKPSQISDYLKIIRAIMDGIPRDDLYKHLNWPKNKASNYYREIDRKGIRKIIGKYLEN